MKTLLLFAMLLLCARHALAQSRAEGASEQSPGMTAETGRAMKLPPYANMVEGKSEAVHFPDLAWMMFTMVAGLEDKRPRGGVELISGSMGVPSAEADALLYHIRRSIEQVNQAASSETSAVCSQAQITERSSRQEIAAAMAETDRRLNALRETFVSQVGQHVSQESEARIVEWVNRHIKPTYVAVSVDYSVWIETTTLTTEELAVKLCRTDKS